MQTHGLTLPQLKARVRSLQYRQRTLTPRKQALREMIVKVDELRSSGEVISVEEYDVRTPQPPITIAHRACSFPPCSLAI